MRRHALFALCLALLLPLLAPATAPAAEAAQEPAAAKGEMDAQQKQAVQKILDDPAKLAQALTGKGATSFPGPVVPQNQQPGQAAKPQPGQNPGRPKAIYGDIIIYK